MASVFSIPDIDRIRVDENDIILHSKYYISSIGEYINVKSLILKLLPVHLEIDPEITLIFDQVYKLSAKVDLIPNRDIIFPRLNFLGITSDDWDECFYGVSKSVGFVSESSLAIMLENDSYVRLSFGSAFVVVNSSL